MEVSDSLCCGREEEGLSRICHANRDRSLTLLLGHWSTPCLPAPACAIESSGTKNRLISAEDTTKMDDENFEENAGKRVRHLQYNQLES